MMVFLNHIKIQLKERNSLIYSKDCLFFSYISSSSLSVLKKISPSLSPLFHSCPSKFLSPLSSLSYKVTTSKHQFSPLKQSVKAYTNNDSFDLGLGRWVFRWRFDFGFSIVEFFIKGLILGFLLVGLGWFFIWFSFFKLILWLKDHVL